MTTKQALFAGGCFWCIEAAMRMKEGVVDVVSGYAGEGVQGATYEQVGSHEVKARESVQITYDTSVLPYKELVKHFFSKIDPTDDGGQFGDRGYSYTTAVYYSSDEEKQTAEEVINELNNSETYDKPIATLVEPITDFQPAEEYHQDYAKKNPVRYGLYHEGSGRGKYEREMEEKTKK